MLIPFFWFGSLIEKASEQYKRQCSEIFLDEWGTSGRRRPTVRVLRQYLEKAKLKRAMVYVSGKLLGGSMALFHFRLISQY